MEPEQKNNTSITSKKKLVFIALSFLVLIFFFLSLEFALRRLDYGVNTSLFGRQKILEKTYHVMNPDIKYRYFGAMPFTPSTSIHYFLVPKPEGVYRIFCLGGSTTAGYPYYFNSSFPSFLSGRLKALFQEKNIEVINLGMTATNSFTTLDIAEELAECQPDLIIVYDGHNEFYGALGVASNQTSGSLRFLTRLQLRLIHFRSYQLLQNAIYKLTALFKSEDPATSPVTVMEKMAYGQYIPYGNNTYNTAYSIFRENLNDLKNFCRSKGIPLILGTQVSNLRDQHPFISRNSTHLSEQQSNLFQHLYKSGIENQSRGSIDSAIFCFRSAIALDSLYADSHYRLAQCLDTLGKKQEALYQYIIARDYDELRFRTDSKFNELIQSMTDNKYCFVTDVEKYFKSLSPDSLIGHNLITEHLHPNLKGNFLIAKCYAQVMREHGMLAAHQEWEYADTLCEENIWQNRYSTDIDEQMGIQSVKVVTSGWPFKPQAPSTGYIPLADTLNHIAQSLAVGKTGWMDAHLLAIDFYKQRGNRTKVEHEYKTLINTYPHIIDFYMQLAKIYFENRRFEDMEDILLRSLQVCPTLLAYRSLGNIMLDKGDPAGALKYFEKMDGFLQDPNEKTQNSFIISYAYVKAGQFQKAVIRLEQILIESPNFDPAAKLLTYVNKQIETNLKQKK